jgi:TctA family transporter
MAENNFRKTLMLFPEDLSKFLEHQIAMGFLTALVALTLVKVILSRQGPGSWFTKKDEGIP